MPRKRFLLIWIKKHWTFASQSTWTLIWRLCRHHLLLLLLCCLCHNRLHSQHPRFLILHRLECVAYRWCDTGSSHENNWHTNYGAGSPWHRHFYLLRYGTISATGCIYTTAVSQFTRCVPCCWGLSKNTDNCISPGGIPPTLSTKHWAKVFIVVDTAPPKIIANTAAFGGWRVRSNHATRTASNCAYSTKFWWKFFIRTDRIWTLRSTREKGYTVPINILFSLHV